jgi:glycosyltransferase involved in cell wall biosynthesis
MNNCLVLITNSYPYSSEESFLEPELPYLAERFKKIIILAIGLGKGAEQTRVVPDNTDCYNVIPQTRRISRAISFVTGAVRSLLPADKDADPEVKGDFKKRVFYEYFRARGEREYAQCEKILDKYDFSEFDSVTVYSYWFFATALVGAKIQDYLKPKSKKVRLVSRAHRYDIYEYANSLKYLPMRKYLLDRFDEIYPCSIDGEKYILEKYPEYKDKVKHRYLGTNDCGVSQMNDDCFHIVSCSRMVGIKRVERIATALSLIDKENTPKLKWTHIGDGETMEKVKEICEEKLGFMDVSLVGLIPNTQVQKFYKNENVDLFINVSTTEGLPVSIMEALSYSVPVIATDVGGTGEIVKDGYNGILIPSDFSDEELADQIQKIVFRDRLQRQQMRDNARQFWMDNFNSEETLRRFSENLVV